MNWLQAGSCLIADAIGVGQIGLRDVVGHIRRQLAIGRAVADLQNIGIRRTGDFQLLEDDGRLQAGGGFIHRLFERVLFDFAQVELIHHRPQHRVRLNQFHLRGDELIGVVGGAARGLLAEDGGGHLPVDIDHDGGFVDRRQAQRNNERGQNGRSHECCDPRGVPPQNP